jgi:hypothetical protein
MRSRSCSICTATTLLLEMSMALSFANAPPCSAATTHPMSCTRLCEKLMVLISC